MTATKRAQADVLHEPSAWLRGRVAERVAAVRALGLDPCTASPVIVAPLGRPGVPGERSDRECDRCGTYVPEGQKFVLSQLHALPGLLLVGGLCSSCAAAEVGEVPQ